MNVLMRSLGVSAILLSIGSAAHADDLCSEIAERVSLLEAAHQQLDLVRAEHQIRTQALQNARNQLALAKRYTAAVAAYEAATIKLDVAERKANEVRQRTGDVSARPAVLQAKADLEQARRIVFSDNRLAPGFRDLLIVNPDLLRDRAWVKTFGEAQWPKVECKAGDKNGGSLERAWCEWNVIDVDSDEFRGNLALGTKDTLWKKLTDNHLNGLRAQFVALRDAQTELDRTILDEQDDALSGADKAALAAELDSKRERDRRYTAVRRISVDYVAAYGRVSIEEERNLVATLTEKVRVLEDEVGELERDEVLLTDFEIPERTSGLANTRAAHDAGLRGVVDAGLAELDAARQAGSGVQICRQHLSAAFVAVGDASRFLDVNARCADPSFGEYRSVLEGRRQEILSELCADNEDVMVGFELPDLRGQTFEQAKARLSAMGLRPARGDADTPDRVDLAGTVRYTRPAAATVVQPGDLILVHYFESLTRVPDLIGRTREEALATLGRQKLGGKAVEGHADPAHLGTISQQDIGAGQVVLPGSTVTFVYHPVSPTSSPDPDAGLLVRDSTPGVRELEHGESGNFPSSGASTNPQVSDERAAQTVNEVVLGPDEGTPDWGSLRSDVKEAEVSVAPQVKEETEVADEHTQWAERVSQVSRNASAEASRRGSDVFREERNNSGGTELAESILGIYRTIQSGQGGGVSATANPSVDEVFERAHRNTPYTTAPTSTSSNLPRPVQGGNVATGSGSRGPGLGEFPVGPSDMVSTGNCGIYSSRASAHLARISTLSSRLQNRALSDEERRVVSQEMLDERHTGAAICREAKASGCSVPGLVC